jgi:hypothetical protein
MSYNGTIDYFVDNVFNFPTMGEAYKIAALDGIESSAGRDDAAKRTR